VVDMINAEGDRATWQTLQSVRTTTVLDSIKVAKRNPEIECFSTPPAGRRTRCATYSPAVVARSDVQHS